MRRTVLALMAAALGLLALLGVFLGGGDERSVEVGQNRFVNPPGLINANNSPSVARNPRRPSNVVVSHRQDLPGFSAAVEWSENDGVTWTNSPLPLPAGKDRPFAPDVAFAPDGTLYVTYVNLQGNGNRPEVLWLSRSTDGGRTFSDPVQVAGALSFQARVAVDGDGTVHITWLKVADVAPATIIEGDNPIVAVRSTDGGQTFTAPVRVSDADRPRLGAASPAIDDEGNLVVLYQDFKGDRRDFQNLDGPAWEEPFALVLTRSTDGGKTFSTGVELESNVVPVARFLVFLPEFPSVAAGADGSLYVAWADGRNGDQDAFVRRSSDDGRTWGAAVRVNDTPMSDGSSQYMPRVSVAPNGRVDVLYLDRRNDPDNELNDAYLATSYNDGRTFSSVRVSSKSFDSRVGFAPNPNVEPDFGSRIGLSSTNENAVAAWTDTRFGTEDTGRQDIASARIVFSGGEKGGLGKPSVVVALLVLSGLCLAGALLGGRTGKGSQPAPGRGRVAA